MAMASAAVPAMLEQLQEMGSDHYFAGAVDRDGLSVPLDEVLGRFVRLRA